MLGTEFVGVQTLDPNVNFDAVCLACLMESKSEKTHWAIAVQKTR